MPLRLPDPQLCYGLRSFIESRCFGRERATSGSVLAAMFDTHPRRIGEAISFLVAEGAPIGSTAADGYWWLASETERQAALAPERRRLAALARRVKGLDRALYEGIQRALALGGRAG